MSQALTFTLFIPNCTIFPLKYPKPSLHNNNNNNNNVRMMVCRAAAVEYAEAPTSSSSSSSSKSNRGPRRQTRSSSSSLYDILGLNNHNASTVEIKAAYRNMAKLYHPDASSLESSDGREFMEIHSAYETLSDPTARALYDLSLGIGLGLRRNRYSVSVSVDHRRTSRRWETDQCW